LNDGKGKFTALPQDQGDFTWQYARDPDDTSCGVVIGDANRDGRPDIVVGSHFSSPWKVGGVPVRLYLQQEPSGDLPRFVDVTEKAGLVPLPMKSPHVEIQDFDNDTWPDIYTSIVKYADGQSHPFIFRGLGLKDSVPTFQCDALGVNDFPTAEDLKVAGPGEFFKKMMNDHKIVYTAPGPTADYDRDGRLDMFLANWWVEQPSLLLHNETKAGHWVDVAVEGPAGVNSKGIGAAVRVFRPGMLGDPAGLIGAREIASGYGYASGQEAIAHFGLADLEKCDIEVILPHGKGRLERKDVAADQRITIGSKP
jgi:hypothetical protein